MNLSSTAVPDHKLRKRCYKAEGIRTDENTFSKLIHTAQVKLLSKVKCHVFLRYTIKFI